MGYDCCRWKSLGIFMSAVSNTPITHIRYVQDILAGLRLVIVLYVYFFFFGFQGEEGCCHGAAREDGEG